MKTGWVIVILLLLIYGFILAHKIDLITADLGRHIKNGEILLKTWSFDVIKTNFYSYTETNFPTVNHHWLSGVLFFIFWKIGGFAGIHLFFIFVSLLTFLIFFEIAARGHHPLNPPPYLPADATHQALQVGEGGGKEGKVKYSNLGIASIIAIIAIPLLAERTEIRPEAFSYLFSGIFLWLLLKFKENKISFKKLLLILLPIQIIWVNTHIFFFLGIAIAGTFIFEKPKKIFILLTLLSAVSFINPFGVNGLLEPLKIFREYGYLLAENQTVWFLENYGIWRPNFEIFKFALILGGLSFVWILLKKKRGLLTLQNFLLFLGISGMAVFQSRNLAIFGFFLMPTLAQNIKMAEISVLETLKKEIRYLALGLSFLAFFLLISTNVVYTFPYWKNFGLGLEKTNSAPVEFFKKENLNGPIFNNYDIGGYLIFNLFPQEKVFVDNRPEAYSIDFFKKTYIPAQENNQKWEELDKKYGFQTIIFSHRDLTPWGQNFLKARLEDTKWKKVFINEKIIIFTPTP